MVMGVDVADLDAVPEALRRHRLVVLRSRPLDVEEQVRFTARLGTVVGRAADVPQVRYEDERGHPDQALFNEQWHADLSWCEEGPTITVLYGLAVGRRAAPTAFADTVSAYDRLPADLLEAAGGWHARHHVEHSRVLRYGRRSPSRSRSRSLPLHRSRGRRPVVGPGRRAQVPTYVDEPGVAHPVVVTDPASGRPGILLGDHAWTLDGFPEAEGRELVEDLQARVVEVGEQYVHRWRAGDLVVYDNRTILHRREPMARAGRRRVLRRTVAWPGDP